MADKKKHICKVTCLATGKKIPKKASKSYGNGSLQMWSRHWSWLTCTCPRPSLLTYLLKILGAFILGIRHHFPSPGPPQHKSMAGPAIPDRSSPSRVYTAIDRNENWEPSSSQATFTFLANLSSLRSSKLILLCPLLSLFISSQRCLWFSGHLYSQKAPSVVRQPQSH